MESTFVYFPPCLGGAIGNNKTPEQSRAGGNLSRLIRLREPQKIPQVSADLQKQRASPAPDRSLKGMQTLHHVPESPEGQYGDGGGRMISLNRQGAQEELAGLQE